MLTTDEVVSSENKVFQKVITDASLIVPVPELTIVVPTFNERNNVPLLIDRLDTSLKGYDWEVIFVDDNSPDGTSDAAREIGKHDHRVRCIRRINRRGVSSAAIEGALASQASYVAVMDGDLQHDETLLPKMLEQLSNRDIDLVVATRYANGGSSESFTASRALISQWCSAIARRLLGVTLSDPNSGFFMIRRNIIEKVAPTLSIDGSKILLDIITSSNEKLRVTELPYSFRKREHGVSKLDARTALDFIMLVIGKLTAGLIPVRFLMFSFVGVIGLGLHMVLLNLGLKYGLTFEVAQILTTILIIACNFTLNNAITYADQRLVGKYFFAGLIGFEIICSVGLVSNVGIARWLYDGGNTWWLAGLSGAIMGVIWNYMVSATLVWKKR